MTQNEFEFLREALAGKCDRLLVEIVENNNLRKKSEEKAKELAEQKEKEKKGEDNE